MADKDYRIGRFTELVEFLKPEYIVKDTGSRNTCWEPAFERSAEVTDCMLEQRETQSALPEYETFVVKTWVVDDADTSWKLQWNGILYDIVKVVKHTSSISFYYIERSDLCNE